MNFRSVNHCLNSFIKRNSSIRPVRRTYNQIPVSRLLHLKPAKKSCNLCDNFSVCISCTLLQDTYNVIGYIDRNHTIGNRIPCPTSRSGRMLLDLFDTIDGIFDYLT